MKHIKIDIEYGNINDLKDQLKDIIKEIKEGGAICITNRYKYSIEDVKIEGDKIEN